MRRTRQTTVDELREDFLAGKSEDYRNAFNNKTLDQQYAAIANWKRNAKNLASASKDLAKVTASTVVSYLKEAHKKLVKLENLSPKEASKIQNLLDEVRGAIDNFDRIKKQQLIDALKAEKEKLAKQNDSIDRQLEALQNGLN